jgi:hypothetical protein
LNKEDKESIVNILLVSLVFFLIITIGYSFNFINFLLSIVFFLSLYLPIYFIKKMSKGEIKFIFIPFIFGKVEIGEIYHSDYYKKFPCWLICSLFFSSLTLFKIPVLFIGRLIFEGWLNPIKQYDSDEENSENILISKYLSFFFLFNIGFSLFLFLINPLLAIVPAIVNFYLIWPIPGNLGFDLYYMNFKEWLKTMPIVLASSLVIIMASLLFLGINISSVSSF